MKSILSVLLMLTVPCIATAQFVKGTVINESGDILKGATVSWLGSRKGTVTNDSGHFAISITKRLPQNLLVSFVGYKSDTSYVRDTNQLTITLRQRTSLTDIFVEGNRRASYIANLAIKTEVISSLELKKAACCDLAGCFETQASVQPQTTNIITNSKELRILGLSGIYNQILIDGFPMIQGLTYTYGISSIPGPLVENIFVAKGTGSVLQGYESISGQINVLTKEPDKADKLFVNGYINSFAEKQLNVFYAVKKKKWSNITSFHMVQPANRVDKDGDSFIDVPLLRRYSISSRWKKGDENKWGWSSQFSVRFLTERRIGGQTNFNYQNDKGTNNAYGQAVNVSQPEVWFKTAYRLNDVHRFALYASGFYQHQRSYFGVTNYTARQTNGYANVQHEWTYKTNSTLKSGLSFRQFNLNEKISFSNNSLNRTYASIYRKIESIPGVFIENALNIAGDKLTWIAGIRADHHNRFGWNVTPRTLLKFAVNDKLVLRASIGTGWRTANIFSENIGLLASSRNIVFAEALQPEEALNAGFNATQKFKFKDVEGYVSFDFYNTTFQNQIFPDFDADPTQSIIKNFKGKSVSNGFQAEASGIFYNRLAMKIGYVFLDVYQVKNGGKDVLPFNPRHRLNGSASFMPLTKKWHLDANVHWYGTQRLPNTAANPPAYQMASKSEPYTIVNSQFTHTFKSLEAYIGVENIFNFRQNKPIISWQDPFGKYFDTQFAWGPTRGREAYLGIRYTIK
jgi:outer membrane receptor for ferrienterochelin and colicins